MLLHILLSCSATDFPECTSSFECYTEFGMGYVCENPDSTNEHRYCAQPSKNSDGSFSPEELQNALSMCQTTTPNGLFENWDSRSSDHLIGSLYYETASHSGQHLTKAIDIAVEKANRNKVDGRGFTVIHCNYYEDGQYSETRVREAIDFLVGELNVPVVLGPYTSTAALAADNQNNSKERKAVLISGSVTTATDSLVNDYFWRTKQ